MAELNLRVSASVDRNLQVAYAPLVEGAKRARAAIEAEGKKGGRAISTETKKGTKDAEARFKELEQAITSGMPRATNVGVKAVKDFAKQTETSFAATRRQFDELARASEANMRKISRSQKQAQAGIGPKPIYSGGGSSFAGLGTMGIGLGRRAIGAAIGVARDLAAGAGVDTSFGSVVKKNVDLETRMTNLSNAGLMAGDKRNNTRIDPKLLVQEALAVGTKTGSDANVAGEGLEKFVGKTGDLRTGRDILEQMAVYAKATGSSLEDMMDASGDIANQLEGVEDKGKAIKDLMRGFAGQGKLGAVEIKNLATQMAKIGAAAGTFEGGKDAILQMGVLAQMARQSGGGATATNAATSVGAFAAMFSKGKRLDAFAKFGVDTVGEGGRVKAPKELIIAALKAAESHGGLKMFDRNMGQMVAESSARKATKGFEHVYRDAGGGAAGVQAVTDAFDRLEKAAISDEEIMSSFQRAMKTSASQADVFNNEMRKSALQMQTDLAPAMASLAKEIIPLVAGFAKWVGHITGDKQADTISGMAETDVSEAIAATKKQTAGHKISDAQLAQNKIAASEAFEARARAAAELKAAEDKLADKQKSGEYDLLSNPLIANRWDKGFMGNLLGTSEEADKKDIAEKKANLEKNSKLLDDINANNKDVSAQLKAGITVRIANVEELKAAVSPPGVDEHGRTPPPGTKPERK